MSRRWMMCRHLGLAAAAGAMIALGACSNSSEPPIVDNLPPPAASSPEGAIRLLEWCWNNRDLTFYRELFTDDFIFALSALDSTGAPYRSDRFAREFELSAAEGLFVTGRPNAPVAQSISLIFDEALAFTNDPRPGKNPRWHKTVRTSVALHVTTVDRTNIRISGDARFYLVRGDSAAIPPDLVLRGFEPDSARWYVERWEDETGLGYDTMSPQPTMRWTWGSLKSIYVGPVETSH